MPYNPLKHNRQSIRLRGYDYALPGAYFVTFCVQGFEHRFGRIINGVVQLNPAGLMAAKSWLLMPERFETMELDEFVVMPNHFHALVIILDIPGAHPHTLGDMIGAFKSITTNHYIHGVKNSGWPPFNKRLWQRNYHDVIVRDERAFNNIRNYIRNNPKKWEIDRYQRGQKP